MLSANFFLLRSFPLEKIKKRSLVVIFSSIYLGMYDLALYVGYSIYLGVLLLPHLNLTQEFLIFSTILICFQIAKVSGFIWFYHSVSKQNTLIAPGVISICYLLMAGLPSYNHWGIWALVYFLALRIIQGIAFGIENALTICYANTKINRNHKHFMLYFIIFSGEVGVFVAIFINRLLAHIEITSLKISIFLRFQFFVAAIFVILTIILRLKEKDNSSIISRYSRLNFFYTIRKSKKQILSRALILSLPVILMMLIIFRIPCYLDLAIGFSHTKISVILLEITAMIFCGSFITKQVARFIPAVFIMISLYCFMIVFELFSLYTHAAVSHYLIWLWVHGFVYGALLRMSPLLLYPIKDFHVRSFIIGRYLGGLLAYSVFGSFALLAMDAVHYLTQNFRGDSPEYIIIIATLCGLFSLKPYIKQFLK